MSEIRLISPLLDNLIIGTPISSHHGIACYPALQKETERKYIVKKVSVPSSQSQMEALLLTGAFSNEADVLAYFKEMANNVVSEAEMLKEFSEQEGFVAYEGSQIVEMANGKGYEVYLLGQYRHTLEKRMQDNLLTHLDALNFGLDVCSALSVCRRSGYLCVDVKPSNVFITEDRLFQIGDLGFIPMDSLKYAGLPEKYISSYTPVEIRDAYSDLNHTIDVYAVGMILYQIYNNGILPDMGDTGSSSELPPPACADTELSNIILKACAQNPDDRWQDPTQMGQAIINYMQLNGANDSLLVTVPPTSADTSENASADETFDLPEDAEIETDAINDDYDAITDEVSEILSIADALMSHDIPGLPVAPAYVAVALPAQETEKEHEEDASDSKTVIETEETVTEEDLSRQESRKNFLRFVSILLVAVLSFVCTLYYYNNYYLLSVEAITVTGTNDTLTVKLTTDAEDALLQVLCSDAYGNQYTAALEDGCAEFTGLVPNSAYSIKIQPNGFHKVVGTTSATYSTPVQSKILQFDAVAGNTEDSVILSFSVDGPDSKEWVIQYFAIGEELRSVTFSSHIVTLTNLSVGKEYTFRLMPKQTLFITGQTELLFTPSQLIQAENLRIVSCADQTIAIMWDAPQGGTPISWSVRCTGKNYSQTIVAEETSAVFRNVDLSQEYNIEVKALGMSVSQGITVPANATQ